MRTKCVSYPRDEPLIVIRQSQLRICGGNHCAAALLSFFEYWHDNRMRNQQQAEHKNRVAQQHGEIPTQDTSLLQYHTEEALEEGLLHLYGRTMIRRALAKLIEHGFVSVHENPNGRYRFDKTHYFLFHPEKVQKAIVNEKSSQVIDFVDEVKVTDRDVISEPPSIKSNAPIAEITDREETPSVSSSEETSSPAHANDATDSSTEKGSKRQPSTKHNAQLVLSYLNATLEHQFEITTHIERVLRTRQGTVDDCKLVIDWLYAVDRLRNPEGYEKYANAKSPFLIDNFDRLRGWARKWEKDGRPPYTHLARASSQNGALNKAEARAAYNREQSQLALEETQRRERAGSESFLQCLASPRHDV